MRRRKGTKTVVPTTMPTPRKSRRPKAGGRANEPTLKRTVASFKGSEAFAAWFEGLVSFRRMAASSVIEHALIEYAERYGYKDKPPER